MSSPDLSAQLLRQVVSGRLADQRFAAARRAVKEEALRGGVLEFLEQLLMQERQLDRVADRLQRFLLAADFFPRQLRHVVEVMIARLRAGEQFERDPVIRIHPHFVAGFQRRLRQLRGALQDERLHPVLGADAEAIGAEHFGDLRHRPRGFKTEIADNDVGFVDQHARPFLQLREADPRIDVAIIIRAADDDLRGVARRTAEESPDPVRGRGHFFDHLLELLDHLARVAYHLFLGRDLGPEGEEPFTGEIIHREEATARSKRLEQADLVLVVQANRMVSNSLLFVAHSLFSLVLTFLR